MEFINYLIVLRRWGWLIVLTSFVVGLGSFVVAKLQPPQYQSSVTIQVGSAQYAQNPATDQILSSQQLADTYAIIVKTNPILELVINKLKLNIKPVELNRIFQVSIIPSTSLLKITVTYNDPIMTASIANEIGAELIANSPISSLKAQKEQEEFLASEIDATKMQLEKARQDLKTTDDQIAEAGSSANTEINTRHNELIGQINAAQNNLAQLATTLADLQKESSSNSLYILEPAYPADRPSGPPIIGIVFLGAVLGGSLVSGILLFVEYMADTIRNPAELNVRFGLNIVGTIPRFGKKGTYADKLIIGHSTKASIVEAYRGLKVNLTHLEKENSKRPYVYVITSLNPDDGKSITAANLAITYAFGGLRVLLIDADLRRSTQHIIFGLENQIGLTDALAHKTLLKKMPIIRRNNGKSKPNSNSYDTFWDTSIDSGVSILPPRFINKTDISGLDIITSGSNPSISVDTLGAILEQDLIQQLASTTDYDIVIFDTPPLLAVTDSIVITNLANARVIMIIDPNHTKRGPLIHALQKLNILSIPLVGIVLNRVYPRELDASYGAYANRKYESVKSSDKTEVTNSETNTRQLQD